MFEISHRRNSAYLIRAGLSSSSDTENNQNHKVDRVPSIELNQANLNRLIPPTDGMLLMSRKRSKTLSTSPPLFSGIG